MKSDAELLGSYGRTRSEADFATFVQRHLDFVYRAALRRSANDPHRASEISQHVFTEAARRASTLADHPCLVGWLHAATRHAAINLARADRRRQARETVAFQMTSSPGSERPLDWDQLQPVIDAALDTLAAADRDVVLARYFEERSFREIGERLQVSENAARMRADRALEKLRTALHRRGVHSTAAALAIALTAQPAPAAAPAGLCGAICTAAMAHPPVTAIALLAMNKLKLAIALIAFGAIVAPPLLQLRANQRLDAELAQLRAAERDARSEYAHATAAVAAAATPSTQAETDQLLALRRRAEILRKRPPGVLEAELHAPANVGWATPEAAFETVTWAFRNDDWRTMGMVLTYDSATRAKAEEYYATLPDAVRQQYPTMEEYFAHAWYAGSLPNRVRNAPARIQVLTTELVDGPAPIMLNAWGVLADGREIPSHVQFERTAAGWGLAAKQTAQVVAAIIGKKDPMTEQRGAQTGAQP